MNGTRTNASRFTKLEVCLFNDLELQPSMTPIEHDTVACQSRHIYEICYAPSDTSFTLTLPGRVRGQVIGHCDLILVPHHHAHIVFKVDVGCEWVHVSVVPVMFLVIEIEVLEHRVGIDVDGKRIVLGLLRPQGSIVVLFEGKTSGRHICMK
jgi:hypothetical protein